MSFLLTTTAFLYLSEMLEQLTQPHFAQSDYRNVNQTNDSQQGCLGCRTLEWREDIHRADQFDALKFPLC